MPAAPLRPRHYEPIPGLVRRTRGDLTREELRERGHRTLLTLDLLETRPAKPALVSSAHGRITRLLLTVPAYAAGARSLSAIYRDLLSELPTGTRLVILTHEDAASTVKRWLSAAGRQDDTVIEAPDHLNFSVWAEDGYVVTTDAEGGGTYFVEPYSFPRYGDGLVAELVSNATDLKKGQAPLYFQGGNVLVGDDFFFIGADYPAESLRYIGDVLIPERGESPAALVKRLYREYLDSGRQLLYVGSTVPVPAEKERSTTVDGQRWTEIIYAGNATGTAQPLFHIDMFITLAGRDGDGRYRVLVGDPGLAAKLLGERPRPHAMQEAFDSIAAGLRRLRFTVIRNPLPLVYVDDPARRERFWYFATANNALVEDGGEGHRHVYLPTYAHGAWASLTPVDERNALIWQELGFSVHLLPDCHPLAENLGAVHCIKKYLARSV
jgi:hypothetical protein